MRLLISVLALLLLPQAQAQAQAQVAGCDIRWPDPGIRIPQQVRSFILAECHRYKGSSEETVEACIKGEQYGYRAVVMMLVNEDTGDLAAERYRACRIGLGAEGGRFHRRRAECIGTRFGYLWRFEFMERAAIAAERTASAALPVVR